VFLWVVFITHLLVCMDISIMHLLVSKTLHKNSSLTLAMQLDVLFSYGSAIT